jgi:hypothetical protein
VYSDKLKSTITKRPANGYACGELRTDIKDLTLKDQIDLYYAWLQQRTQASYRGEGWELEFFDWLTHYGDNWKNRGRRAEQYCLTRIDDTKSWSNENVVVRLRSEFLAEHTAKKAKGKWSEEKLQKGRATRAKNTGAK